MPPHAICAAPDSFLKKKGFFAGQADDKHPVFVDIESSGLVLSPAGGGKTTSFVIPALCHISDSMMTPDFKGALACMTAKMRREKHKNEIVVVNPAGLHESLLGQSARYNPLQILIDDWDNPKLHTELFSDANAIARQLCPEPIYGGDNQYWRNGARKFLVFAFLYRVTIEKNASLSNALSLLSDSEQLGDALAVASATDLLNGDLARLAKDMLNKIEKGDPKQVESFREGAVQALEVFSPSGALAESTSRLRLPVF